MSLSGRLSTDNSIEGKVGILNQIQGKSAYEIALLNGFEGTEQEWLASLKGEKGDAYILTEADKEEIADKVIIENDLEVTKTATGSAITIESSQAPLQNLKLFGKTTQNGTPTPDAPVPIVSVGDSGSFEVKIQGENVAEQTLTIPYPLYSMAGHNDEVDFNKGVLIQRCASVTFDGDEAFTYNAGNKQFVTNSATITAVRGTHHKCSHYISVQNADNGLFLSGGTGNAFNFQDTRFNGDVNAYKEWLSANPVTVVFVRATPTETPLTEQELNAYRQLHTNKGTTNILCEADMELSYYAPNEIGQSIGNLHSIINQDYIKSQKG